MKLSYYLIVALVGLTIGIGQIFYVRDVNIAGSETIQKTGPVSCMAISPECGQCLYKTIGDQCVREYTEPRRGFPLSVGPQGILGPQITMAVYLNVLIITLSLPFLLFILLFSFNGYPKDRSML